MNKRMGRTAGWICWGFVMAMQASAGIQYGRENYPAGAASLKTLTVSGPVAPPKLMRADAGVTLKLSGTGGTYGIVKRLGSLQRKGDYLYLSTRISNPTRSFVAVELQLYNATERRILVKSLPVVIRNSESPPINLNLEYHALQRDLGDQLELRWVQCSTEHPSRTFCLEQTTVASIRPMEASETFPGGTFGRLEPAVFSGTAGVPTLEPFTKDADNGDGVGDGAVVVSSKELGGTYGAVWKLGKAVAVGKTLHLETVWFNAGNSFVQVEVQLYNTTDDRILVGSGGSGIRNREELPVTVTLDYPIKSADLGDEWEVRWVQTTTDHTSRNFVIERFSVSESKE